MIFMWILCSQKIVSCCKKTLIVFYSKQHLAVLSTFQKMVLEIKSKEKGNKLLLIIPQS